MRLKLKLAHHLIMSVKKAEYLYKANDVHMFIMKENLKSLELVTCFVLDMFKGKLMAYKCFLGIIL